MDMNCPLYIEPLFFYLYGGNLADRSFAPWACKLEQSHGLRRPHCKDGLPEAIQFNIPQEEAICNG